MSSLIVEVCKVKELRPIEGADRIELAMVKGWQCVVGKGQFEVGEEAIFVPPDSLIPEEVVEKWDISYLKGKPGKQRVGVIKLRGVYSEGLLLVNYHDWPIGKNVAEIYGITKWEPPVKSGRRSDSVTAKHRHPRFFRYTDIERLENYPDVLIPGEPVSITEKLHGTNFRCGTLQRYNPSIMARILSRLGFDRSTEFVYGSRRVQLGTSRYRGWYGKDWYGRMVTEYGLKDIVPEGYLVFGEIFGSQHIQGENFRYGFDYPQVRFFDVMYNGIYVDADSWDGLGWWWKSLPKVPQLYCGPWETGLVDTFNYGTVSTVDAKTVREGIVIKPVVEREYHGLGRVILKALNKEYEAMKNKGTEAH